MRPQQWRSAGFLNWRADIVTDSDVRLQTGLGLETGVGSIFQESVLNSVSDIMDSSSDSVFEGLIDKFHVKTICSQICRNT